MLSQVEHSKLDRETTSADVVIVGGGFAGLTLDTELKRRSQLKVLVIEAGPDSGHTHYREEFGFAEANARWLDPPIDPHFWRPYECSGMAFSGLSAIRRRVGGRSLYWHGMILPIEPWAIHSGQWPEQVEHDLTTSWDDGKSLYSAITEELAEWTQDAGEDLSSGAGMNFAGHTFINGPRAVRKASSDDRWRAYSPFERPSGKSDVLTEARVDEVLTEEGRVTGVRIDHQGSRQVVNGRAVVLAAGTIENSRLAIQQLTALGLLDEPRLTGLVDKVAQGFVATFDLRRLPAELRTAAEARTVLVASGGPELRSNIFLNLSVNPAGVAVVDAYLMGEQVSGPHGSVWCNPATDTPWRTGVSCELGPEDRRLVVTQRAELQRIWAVLCAATGQEVRVLKFPDSGEFGSADLPDRLSKAHSFAEPEETFTYAFPLGSEQHEAATLPLGTVLDDDGQFRAVPGLYACGPATFPRTGAANPVLTTLALARRLAKSLSTVLQS